MTSALFDAAFGDSSEQSQLQTQPQAVSSANTAELSAANRALHDELAVARSEAETAKQSLQNLSPKLEALELARFEADRAHKTALEELTQLRRE